MDANFRARSRWLATHVLPHEPAMRAWLRQFTRLDDHDIDDLVQETYSVLAQLKDVDTIRDPRSYAFQVARSVFLQDLRRRKVVAIGAVADLAELDVRDDLPSPEQHAQGQQELRRVHAAIDAMPPQVRRVFWLRRVEGLSQRETAERLGLAEHTVEKYMTRGVQLLLGQFRLGGGGRPDASSVAAPRLIGPGPVNGRSRTTP